MNIRAYAKLNLGLYVTGTDTEGYHTLDTVMTSVSLYDELDIEPAESFSIEADCALPEDNTITRSVDAFFACRPGVKITLCKHIPSGAGLGGASADAAAVIKALDALYPDMHDEDELRKIALSVGADVPFCMTGGAMRCRGRGEIMTPVTLPELYFVLLPGEELSTASVFRQYDAMKIPYSKETYSNNIDLSRLKNDLQAPAIALSPDIDKRLGILNSLFCDFSLMTGSGSCVYGAYTDRAARDRAAEALRERNIGVIECETGEVK